MANDFDFIVNAPPKKPGPNFLYNPKQRIIALILFFAVIIVVGAVFFSFLSGSNSKGAETYIPIEARQSELLRILKERDDLKDFESLQKYNTLYHFIASDYIESGNYLKKFKVEVTPEIRAKYSFSKFDKDIKTARSVNRFDSEFENYVEKAVQSYATELANFKPTKGQQEMFKTAKSNLITYLGKTNSQAKDNQSQKDKTPQPKPN